MDGGGHRIHNRGMAGNQAGADAAYSRWYVGLRGAAYGVIAIAIVWVARWVGPRVTLDPGQGPIFRQRASRPLLVTGVLAAATAIAGLAASRRQRRSSLLVVVVAAIALLAGGEVAHQREVDVRPRLLSTIRSMRVPSAWRELTHRSTRSDPPGVLVVWQAGDEDAVNACAQLRAAVATWREHRGVTDVSSPSQPCALAGYPPGRQVAAVVVDDPRVIRQRFPEYPIPAATGTLVAVELSIRYFH